MKNYYRLTFPERQLLYVNNKLPYIVFTLDQYVDGECLKEAVRRAVKVHPLFEQKIEKKISGYYFCNNNNTIEIKINANSYGENGFPWIITYNKNKIIFVGHHFLTDANGALSFVKTVLLFYYKKPDTDTVSLNISNVIKKTSTKKDKKFSLKINKPSTIEEHNFEKGKRCHFAIDYDDIDKLSKKYKISNSILLTSIFGKGMSVLSENKDKNVVIDLLVDLRYRMGVVTDRNFATVCKLGFNTKNIQNENFEKRANNFMHQFNLYKNSDYLKNIVNHWYRFRYISVSEYIVKRNFTKNHYNPCLHMSLSYIPNIDWPDNLQKHVRKIDLVPYKECSPPISALAVRYKNKIYCNLVATTKDNIFINTIKNELDNHNVHYDFGYSDYYFIEDKLKI